jgi:hypothetical protein
MCVRGIDFDISTCRLDFDISTCLLDFGTVPTVWYFILFFIVGHITENVITGKQITQVIIKAF